MQIVRMDTCVNKEIVKMHVERKTVAIWQHVLQKIMLGCVCVQMASLVTHTLRAYPVRT